LTVQEFLGLLTEEEIAKAQFHQDVSTRHTSLLSHLCGDYITLEGLQPPHLPDLSQFNFSLWDYVKDSVYNNPCTFDEFKTDVSQIIASITSIMLQAVSSNMLLHAQLYMKHNGGHFQHFFFFCYNINSVRQ
jgi:hypothetical protein